MPYGKIIEISNGAFLRFEKAGIRPREAVKNIGFLSNISASKGIYEFLDVLEDLTALDPSVVGVIAGPFADELTRASVLPRIANNPSINYVGPVYGLEKAEFYRGLDVLLFPTKYRDEAEPVTLLEAMTFGVMPIAWDRGCIRDLLKHCSAKSVIHREADFVSTATAVLWEWIRSPANFAQASTYALQGMTEMPAHWEQAVDRFVAALRNEKSIRGAHNVG